MYKKIKLKGFKLVTKSKGIDVAWLDKLISNLDLFPAVPYAKDRHRGLVAMPSGSPFPNAFVKTYSHTECSHQSFRRRHPFRRLIPRYAVKEGRAYLKFQQSGLAVPGIVAFGEEWKWGIRHRGVIVIEAIDAPCLQQLLHNTPDTIWIPRIFETMARIHNAGMTHGDAHLVNFLCSGKRIVSIDVVNSKPLSNKGRLTDITNVLISIFLEIEDTRAVKSGVNHYEEKTGYRVENIKGLMESALRTACVIRENKNREQKFRAVAPRVLSLK